MATEEITISELELADTVLADMTIPVDTATDTKAVTLKQLKAWLGSSLPTGFIIPAVGKMNDERFTLLDGKTLSRTGTYEAFCNKVVEQVQAGNWFSCSEEEYNADVSTYGQCGKFVVGADYVRIPKITRFVGATITLSEIGKTYAESLPNITGELVEFVHGKKSDTSSGAFKTTFTANGNIGSGSGISYDNTDFDASLSSSTYQDGAKVQPDHTKFPYYMVVSTEGQTASVGIDINKVYEDMNLRANTNLSNISSNIDYVVESYVNGTEWYRVYKSGWIEQGGVTKAQESNSYLVTLLKPYKDTNYNVSVTGKTTSKTDRGWNYAHTLTTTSFLTVQVGSGCFWQAKGQGE